MKKAIVIILVAFVALASAFAFEFKSIGLETGEGILISLDMDIIDNLDVYGRIGYDGQFNISGGAQYKVYDFDVEGTKIDIKPGAQINFGVTNGFTFSILATCQFSFEVKHFGAFARPGIGFGLHTYSYKYAGERHRETNTYFAYAVETGVFYNF